MMQFTPEQTNALSLDRHLAVTANAGSGKTSVLIHRFIRILLETNTELRNVVAITFTVKAAAEMRRKVREELVRRRQEGGDVARLTELMRSIGSARISTIHSFCSALLRKYADVAGVEADLRELRQREASGLLRDAVANAMRSWLHDDDERRSRSLLLFDDLSIDTVEKIVEHLTSSTERRVAMRDWFDKAPTLSDHVRDRSEVIQTIVLDYVKECVDEAASAAAHVLRDASEPKAQEYRAAVVNLRQELFDVSGAGVFVLSHSAFTTLSMAYRRDGQPLKKSAWCQRLPQLSDSVSIERIRDFAQFSSVGNDEVQLRHALTMLQMAETAASFYEAAKRERGGMDFDDMMVRARDLLRIPSIAADVRKSIRYLMIDEFQDTNPLQYEVVKLLIPDLDPTSTETSVPNLFLVGDAKQSIYGFRDADVRLFRQACSEIEAANSRKGLPSGLITLRHSFRMAPPLARALNTVCESCFTVRSEFDVPYEALVASRDVSGTSGLGTMHVLFTKRDDKSFSLEAKHISNMICKLLNGKVPTIHATPGDIAVLTRTSKIYADLSSSLRTAGVPFQVHGGRAFFSRPEVADLRALLVFSTDPDDDLALATLLRSPLCCWTDAEILLARQRASGTLLSGIEDGTTRTFLAQCIDDVHTMQPSAFIRRALERTQWYATIATDLRRDQIISNVEKVIEILQDESARGVPTLRDMILAISEPTTTDREAEGVYETNQNAVQIMTLHAAKGLEFPIVIIAGINNSDGKNNVDQWTDQLGPSLSMPSYDFQPSTPLKPAPRSVNAVHAMNSILSSTKSEAEDKRLLYVGLTRAKDHCFISLPYSIGKEGVGASYGIGKQVMSVLTTYGVALDAEESTDLINGTLQPWYDTTDVDTVNVVGAQSPEVIALDGPISARPTIDILYVTDLLDQRALEDHASGAEDLDRGSTFGTIVHTFLQRIVPAHVAGTNVDEVFRILRADPAIPADLGLHAEQEVRRVITSGRIDAYAASLIGASFEQTIASEIDGTVVLGTMDVRLHRDESHVEVWDWKTTSVATEADRIAAATAYRTQLCAYAWMCLKADQRIQQVTGVLLFTRYASGDPATWIHTTTWRRDEMTDMKNEISAAIARTIDRRIRRSGLLESSPSGYGA